MPLRHLAGDRPAPAGHRIRGAVSVFFSAWLYIKKPGKPLNALLFNGLPGSSYIPHRFAVERSPGSPRHMAQLKDRPNSGRLMGSIDMEDNRTATSAISKGLPLVVGVCLQWQILYQNRQCKHWVLTCATYLSASYKIGGFSNLN